MSFDDGHLSRDYSGMRRLWRYVAGSIRACALRLDDGDRGFAHAFGNGPAFPFLLIYLHNVRGFSLPMVGLIAATSAAARMVTVPMAGP